MMNSYLYILHLLRRLLETLDSVNLIVLKQIEKYLFRIKTVRPLLLVLKHRSGHLTIKAKCLPYLSELPLEHVVQMMPLFFWSVLLRERLIHL